MSSLRFAIAQLSCSTSVLLLISCSTLGPKPDLNVIAAETKATKHVVNILVLPTVGTNSGDPESDINKTMPAGAYKTYGDSLLLMGGLGLSAKTLGMPPHAQQISPINWQVGFHKWVLKTQKKILAAKIVDDDIKLVLGKKAALAKLDGLPLPAKKFPTNPDELKKLAQTLKSQDEGLKPLSKASVSDDANLLLKAADENPEAMANEELLFEHLLQRFKVTYVLASSLFGTEAEFEEDKPIHLFVAMINTKTGRFRYVAHSVGRRSDAPTSYPGLVGLMTINLFDEVESADDMPL